jgi:CRP-like cAMP-binding protein
LNQLFIEFFKKFKHLHPGDIIALYKISSLRTFKEGELIATEGAYFKYTVAIRKGLIRTYVLRSNGDERTVRIAKEGAFTGCAECMLKRKPSCEYMQALENTQVILIDVEEFTKLSKKNIRLLRLWDDAIMDALYEAVHRIEFFVTLTPEERYTSMMEESPDLLHRVPQKYLASFLGVTTVSLSRIRTRVAKKMQ